MARELAPAGLRSGPIFVSAAHSSGSKLPRHMYCINCRTVGKKMPAHCGHFLCGETYFDVSTE
ncbi:hypothetical protein EAH78_21545 [Pseudomonas arsenicoxydans]|uniref:Uncharacterized protein n=1 Tax=Pseudomonas arsenicoxydans TaxID=702115 RepID=A0A502HKZ3_9PSED|nr:hypothetical protein EAH78_21545 [Pseudomonas arsenicoxydans]